MTLTTPHRTLRPVIVLLAVLAVTLLLAPVRSLGQSLEEIRAKALYNELRCVVCAGQSIAESNAELAQDMRAQVDRLILAGQSDAEIRSWFVERYGDAVLMTPPLNALTLGLWFGPVLIFVLGLVVTLLVLRRGQVRLGALGTRDAESNADEQRGGG
jgi:cytochrome c-type biogenesis protein CcmH